MDPNGTRFQLLLGRADWGACSVEGQSATLESVWQTMPTAELLSRQGWDDAHAELTLPTQVFQFPSSPQSVEPGLAARRGADADAYGNWYWIDDSETLILVRSVGSGAVTPFWSVGGATASESIPAQGDFSARTIERPTPATLRGLTVTVDHYLLVGVVQPAGLLVFDLHAGGPPRQLLWPAGFQPFDMASGTSGAWILDRAPTRTSTAARLWRLDRRLNVVGSAYDLTGVANPVAVDVLPDGAALILDNAPSASAGTPAFSQVWTYRSASGRWPVVSAGSGLSGPFSLRDLATLAGEPQLSLFGQDIAFLPATGADAGTMLGRLQVVAQDGQQAYAFAVVPGASGALQFDALPEYLPMRLFGGRGLFTDGARTLYDSRTTWVPLVAQPRTRYAEQLVVVTPVEPNPSRRDVRHAFDGRDPDCVWHRLMLDACVPHDTELHVWSRAANAEADLINADWQPEPDPYRRGDGSELPWVPGRAGADSGTWELLFQRARGRYLQVRIQLAGNTRSSPRLRALRAYYPRFSYLDHYLPATYRDDPRSASFLDRFLANLEGLYTTLEDRLEAIQVLFDPRTAPAEDLTWLATWLGIVLDGNWDAPRQRLMIAYAPELFRLRGTRIGVIRAIRLATDACPTPAIFDAGQDDEVAPTPGRRPSPIRIVEQFRTRRAPGVVFGDTSQLQGPGLSTPTSTWTPAQGPEPLHARFRAYLLRGYGSLSAVGQAWEAAFAQATEIVLPPTQPANPVAAADWARFLQVGLGFTYAPVDSSADAPYRDFLTRRYGTVGALNKAYGLTGAGLLTSFADTSLPTTLPVQLRALQDWIQFASVVAPTVRSAHRFTVLVPTTVGVTDADRGALIDRVRRVVELEKPAHSAFDVKEYWALFRVGEARLGFDSLLDRGSRLAPVALDSSFLAQAYLSYPHPFNVAERMVAGRDHVSDGRPL